LPERVAGALFGAAQEALELGEELLDRIEIGRILRDEDEAGATLVDGAADGLAPVGAEHLSPATKVEVR